MRRIRTALATVKNRLLFLAGKLECETHYYRPDRVILDYSGGNAQAPIFVVFHGGGWFAGTPNDVSHWSKYMAPYASRFLFVEYNVFAIHGGGIDRSISDAVEATLWAEKRFPNKKIILVGFSAGALLALHAAQAVASRIAGMILFSPVTDVGPEGYRNGMIPQARRADISPDPAVFSQLPEDAFIGILHGENDDVVPIECSERFVAALPLSSERKPFVRIPDRNHGFQDHSMIDRSAALSEVEDILHKHGYSRRWTSSTG